MSTSGALPRSEDLLFAEPDTRLEPGGEVVLITRAKDPKGLREQFG